MQCHEDEETCNPYHEDTNLNIREQSMLHKIATHKKEGGEGKGREIEWCSIND